MLANYFAVPLSLFKVLTHHPSPTPLRTSCNHYYFISGVHARGKRGTRVNPNLPSEGLGAVELYNAVTLTSREYYRVIRTGGQVGMALGRPREVPPREAVRFESSLVQIFEFHYIGLGRCFILFSRQSDYI